MQTIMDINQIMASLEAKHPGESEYLQAVKEVLLSIQDIYNQHPEFEKAFARKADKKRKLYNGMIPCELYQFTR